MFISRVGFVVWVCRLRVLGLIVLFVLAVVGRKVVGVLVLKIRLVLLAPWLLLWWCSVTRLMERLRNPWYRETVRERDRKTSREISRPWGVTAIVRLIFR